MAVKYLMIFGVMAFLPLQLYAQGQASKVIAQYEDVFFKKIDEIADNYAAEEKKYHKMYVETLQKYIVSARKQGALYEVQAAKDEIKRFNNERSLVSKNVNKDFDILQKIQVAYIDKFDELKYKRAKSIIGMYEKVINALSNYQVLLTKSGDDNDALWVDEKRKEFEDSYGYKQARKTVEMYEMIHDAKIQSADVEEMPKTSDVDAGADVTESEADNQNSDNESAVDLNNLDPDIYGAIKLDFSKTYPHDHLKEYKRLGLSTRTDVNSGTINLVSYLKELQGDDTGGNQWAYKLRLQLSSNRSKVDYKDCFVVVRYFGSAKKTTNRRDDIFQTTHTGMTRTRIVDLGFQIVQLPLPLTNSKVFLDLPAFPEIESEPWNTTSYQSDNLIRMHDFYGVIVSVYDNNNNIIFQRASSDALRDFAESRPPIDYNIIRNPKDIKIHEAAADM